MAKALILQKEPVPARCVVFDTETTGLSPKHGDKIVEIAAIELLHGIPSGREFHRYIDPCRSVPAVAVNVHGLTAKFLRGKPLFKDILPDWLAFLEDENVPLFAHNAPFDARFMKAEIEMAGYVCGRDYSCTLRLARAVLGKGSHNLANLAALAGAKFGGRGAHSAMADTRVLGSVLTDLLWPAEAEAAVNPAAKASPTNKVSATPKAAAAKATPDRTLALPAGFVALCAQSDARIRRYDDHDFTGLLTARGKRWDRDEEYKLGHSFLVDKMEVPAIVEAFGRSPAAVLLKLEALGVVAPGHPYTRT